MRNYISLIIFGLLFTCGMFANNRASASHAAGGEIIYIHISDSTYQLFFKFYRDCTGISEPGNVQLCIFNNCTNSTTTVTMNKYGGTLPPDNRANGSPVSAGCSQYPNKCINTSSSLPGYREWWYTYVVTLPFKCNSWRYSVSINARNGSQNITGGNLYVETVFNSNISWVNSSPFYSIKPIPYVCLNQDYAYNNGARDSDGDSLWTDVIRPLTSGSCQGPPSQVGLRTLSPAINFNSSNGNPFQTNNTFNLTGTSGQMTFRAGQTGAHALTVRTKEYRNNIEIGSIMRDVQVQVIPCSTKAPDLDTPFIDTTNLKLVNGVFEGCVGQPVDFCFDIVASDTDAIILAEDNLGQPGVPFTGAVSSYTNQGTDSVRFCFTWTPSATDAGKTQSFQMTIKDSTCKPPGILLQYVRDISIYVWPETEASPDTSICAGEPAFLGVKGGGNYSWRVISGTDPAMPANGPAPVGQPTVTTTYEVTSNANSQCKNSNKDTVTIEVKEGPELNPRQPDITTCPDVAIQMDAGIVKLPGVVYDVKWTPATGLSSDTSQTPTVQIKNDRSYYLSVGSDTNRCRTLDTVVVTILDGFSIENPDTAICFGESVKIRGTGDPLYSYLWTADPNDAGAGFTDVSVIPTEITPGDTGTYVYELRGQYAGCPDSVTKIVITTEPIPDVTVNDDDELCFGDTMKLKGIVDPSSYDKYEYIWTPGASLDYPESADPIFTGNKVGETTLNLTVRTADAKCSDSDQVTLTVFPADFLNLPTDTAICAGDTLTIEMAVDGEPSFFWGPDFNISSVSSLQPRVWPVTNQRFTVYGKDSTGCLDTNSIYITVNPRAVVDLPDTVTLYPGETYRMDPGGNALYYTWFPPLGLSRSDVSNPMVNPGVNTRYIVLARTEAGCEVRDSVDVLVMDDSYIEVPNAFTPHMHSNNLLRIIAKGDVELKRFEIYNRWGAKVFETKDINEGWDGTFNGEQQPIGVYVYMIEAVTPTGRSVTKQGNVTLIR